MLDVRATGHGYRANPLDLQQHHGPHLHFAAIHTDIPDPNFPHDLLRRTAT